MKVRTTTLLFEEYDHIDELSAKNKELVNRAIHIATQSYSPYSKFPVGAAVLLDDGQIFCGNNQENISFPAGTCAERTVLNFVKANFPDKKILSIAITATNSTSYNPVTPCGICRQVIVEMETLQMKPIQVLLHKINGCTYVFENSKALLPLAFEEDNLGK
jgi:cytidine deaminase